MIQTHFISGCSDLKYSVVRGQSYSRSNMLEPDFWIVFAISSFNFSVLWPWAVAWKFFYWRMLIFDKCHVMDKYFHIGSKYIYLICLKVYISLNLAEVFSSVVV